MKKIIFIFAAVALLLAFKPEVKAQGVYNLLSSYSSVKDTVSNAGTAYLQTGPIADKTTTVTVVINATELSGTTAGTITLFGSLDGTNWIALTDSTAVPAIAAKTATDVATQSFMWRVSDNPVRYYRVSWTGSGTMSDWFTAQLIVR